ncbi:hypothetical protein AAG906_039003 [Vitis piasezkii]
MMATWSESEESSKEENEKEVANMCFMAIDELDEGSKKDKWFLDSGCSRHMIRDESNRLGHANMDLISQLNKDELVRSLETSMGRLKIEDRRQQKEIGVDPKKEESPLALLPPQQVQKFSKCMHSEFEMSMMGELNFFLGLQIKRLKEGTFINQEKYIRDLLKMFNMEESKTMKTPMSSSIKLDKDEKSIDSTMYKGMIDEVSYYEAFLIDSILTGKQIHLGYLMMMHMISCCESTTLILPYGRFFTRVFKNVGIDLSREIDFEAPNAYDTYDD